MVLASRRERIYQRFPDPVSGYELDPERGYFSVILPEATTNMVTNPSVEGGVTTGYAAYGAGAAMAAIATWQAYGAYGLQLTPASAVESGFYYGNVTLAVSTTYTASVTIQGEEGKKYAIWFATTAGAQIGSKREWIGTGHKQRIWVTHTEDTGAARRVYVARDAQYTDANLFYADGLQVEAKSYPTTYCDGDQVGFVINQAAYLWTGTRGASTSTRSAQTRAGGREVSLLSLGLRVLTVLGLGMDPLVDQALPMPGRGELAQGTGTTAREFTLVTALYADGPGPRHLQALRSGLIDAFKPDAVTVDQPLILRYQACDDEGDPLGESLDIICKYQSGLEGNWDNHQQERLPITFKMHLPLIQNTYDSGTDLIYSAELTDADYIVYRDETGQWHNISTDFNGSVWCIVKGLDGKIWIGGEFNGLGGLGIGNYLAYWENGAVTYIDGFTGGTGIYSMAIAPNGDLYVGGNFTAMDGDATIQRIAHWNGTVWADVGGGIASGNVTALAFGHDGYLYIGGSFLNHGDANGDRITRWTGANYASIGPADNIIYKIIFDKQGNLFVGGSFSTYAGVTAYGLVMVPYLTGIPAPIGTKFSTGNIVYSIVESPNGNIIVGGELHTPDISHATNLALWNRTTWSFIDPDNAGDVFELTYKDDLLYIGGNFASIGDIPLVMSDRFVAYDGSNWFPVDINLPGNPTIYAILADQNILYVGYTTAGSAFIPTVDIPNAGSATAYPVINITGPGTLWKIENHTTGKSISFDITLLAGETAVLNLNPVNPSFISSFRGNIWNTAILKGSNLNFPLMPGANNISAYIYGSTTIATAITMTWREQYWSLDGAAWK